MYDIVFISYNETDADSNYESLKGRFHNTKRVHGVKGIHQAHIAAAKKAFTKMFWAVDADAIVADDFDFSYLAPKHQEDHVHVWQSRNPINDLVYGYGGIKLLPRRMTTKMDLANVDTDMTTSISDKFLLMPEVANITAFNVSPFETWKSAFRECTKLASKVIDRQKNEETEHRLRVWQTVGKDRPYGEFALRGAQAGTAYGRASQGNTEALKQINNFEWLQGLFNEEEQNTYIRM